MEKRYQVFVSSTYTDLKEERQKVMQTLMEMDCIPAGMEIFPAADEEQWEFIKKIIDDCDYYLLIIGGRYGSMTKDGISYTEKEFDYAVEKGIKVVALIHEDPDTLPGKKIDKDPELIEKLAKFKEKVKNGRLVKFWSDGNELPGLVALSLQKTIKRHPAIGWVRGNQIANQEILAKYITVTEKNKALEDEINSLKNLSIFTTGEIILGLEKEFYLSDINGLIFPTTYRQVFFLIAPFIKDFVVKNEFEYDLFSLLRKNFSNFNFELKNLDRNTIDNFLIELDFYELIERNEETIFKKIAEPYFKFKLSDLGLKIYKSILISQNKDVPF